MNSLPTIALGAFAILFFGAALIMGLIVLKKYQEQQARHRQSSRHSENNHKQNNDHKQSNNKR